MAETAAEPLVLKVMRLRRPQLMAPGPSLPPFQLDSSGGGSMGSDVPKLLLPMSLTQSFVGEPFAGYLHLGNHSTSVLTNVVLKVELQIGNQKYMLCSNAASPVENLAPGDFFDTNVEHELRDAGTYVLTCHVSYSMVGASTQEAGSFKRSYRFPALQPFAVVHRVVQVDRHFLVECSVDNATAGSIYLTSWRLDCIDGFEAMPFGAPPTAGGGGSAASSAVTSFTSAAVGATPPRATGIARLLKPRGSHSIVFRVSPKEGEVDAARLKEVELVGTLVLGWHVPDGPSGCVEGHQIRMKAASAPALDLRVVSCPMQVRIEEPFDIEVEVLNRTGLLTEPTIAFDTRIMGSVKVQGATQISLGQLGPHCRTQVPLHLFVVVPGMHGLQGIALLDDLTRARNEFGSLCDVLAF